MRTKLGIKGKVTIISRDIESGEIVDFYEDHNRIVDQGINYILKALSTSGTDNYCVKTVVLGNDVGSGTILNPQEPTADLDESDQSVVFTIPSPDFQATYPSNNTVRYSATVNGGDVMLLYPEQPNVIYTSAVLLSQDNKAIAYIRVPGRTISSAISIQIIWDIELNWVND